MSNGVVYRDCTLSKNSFAYQLWLKKDFKALDKHMKELDVKNEQLLQRYK